MIIKILQPQAIYELGQRGNQEDTIYPVLGKATASDRLFIVCDGMGGHEHGEVASGEFTRGLAEYFDRNVKPDEPFHDDMLTDAIAYAYQILDKADDGNFKKMGTTLTLIYIHSGGVTAAHIGDSRIYHIRPGKENLYVSRDHSLVFDLYQSGEISFEEMKTYKHKNVITRAVQPGEDNRSRPDIIHITDIEPGDYFYLCSDGMLEQMDDDEILRLFSSSESNAAKRQRLIDATKNNADNHSAYIIQVETVQHEEADKLITGNEEKTSRYNALNIKPAVIGAVPSNEGVVMVQPAPVEVEPIDAGPETPPPFNPAEQPQADMTRPQVQVTQSRPEPVNAPRPSSPLSRLWPLLLLALAAAAIAAYLLLGDRNKKDDGDNAGKESVSLPIQKRSNEEVREVNRPSKDVERRVEQEVRQQQPAQKPGEEVKNPDAKVSPENNKVTTPTKNEEGKKGGKRQEVNIRKGMKNYHPERSNPTSGGGEVNGEKPAGGGENPVNTVETPGTGSI